MAQIAIKDFNKELKVFEYSMAGLNSIDNFLIYAEKILEPCPFFQKKYKVNYGYDRNITMNSIEELRKYVKPVNIIENIHTITCPIEFASKKVTVYYNLENSTAVLKARNDATILSESSFKRIGDELMLT